MSVTSKISIKKYYFVFLYVFQSLSEKAWAAHMLSRYFFQKPALYLEKENWSLYRSQLQ